MAAVPVAQAAHMPPGGAAALSSSVGLVTHKVATPTRPTPQVLWTPRSTPRGGQGPEVPWETILPGSPCRLSPRMERPAGRKAVDQPGGGPRMTAVL
eukprot:scaffold47402_cov39-Phaeocystis_antarctica.AAC.2